MTAQRATRRALRRRAALTRREGPLTGAKLPALERRRAPRRLAGPRPRRPGPLVRRRGWVDSARGGRESSLREGLQQPRRARCVVGRGSFRRRSIVGSRNVRTCNRRCGLDGRGAFDEGSGGGAARREGSPAGTDCDAGSGGGVAGTDRAAVGIEGGDDARTAAGTTGTDCDAVGIGGLRRGAPEIHQP